MVIEQLRRRYVQDEGGCDMGSFLQKLWVSYRSFKQKLWVEYRSLLQNTVVANPSFNNRTCKFQRLLWWRVIP